MHLLRSSHMLTCSPAHRSASGIQSPKFASAQILTQAHLIRDLEYKIQRSKICISSHRHLPKDLESKIKKLHELTSSHMLICLEFWNPKLKICISFDLHTCSPAQRSGIKNLKFALAHSPHMLACWCSLSAQCSAHVLTDLESKIRNSPPKS